MRNKFRIVLILLTLGFLTKPELIYACGTNMAQTENSCCENNNSDTNKKDKDCDGNCTNSNCCCATLYITIALPFVTEFTTNTNLAESKKSKTYYNITYLSSGFVSIWIPPNIG